MILLKEDNRNMKMILNFQEDKTMISRKRSMRTPISSSTTIINSLWLKIKFRDSKTSSTKKKRELELYKKLLIIKNKQLKTWEDRTIRFVIK